MKVKSSNAHIVNTKLHRNQTLRHIQNLSMKAKSFHAHIVISKQLLKKALRNTYKDSMNNEAEAKSYQKVAMEDKFTSLNQQSLGAPGCRLPGSRWSLLRI